MLKYVKDQLCSSCEVSKAKRSSFKIKAVSSSKGRLNLLHIDLCGLMRIASINGKKYILETWAYKFPNYKQIGKEKSCKRVLVIKPHNKTPYELFLGRKPALSFMRPFGCPVTILNTIDHLGKFDGKADEGFFVGYSTDSKAFRVFNNRTRIVEESRQVKFSENTPNIAGSRLNWLFDIDALTKYMNYKPDVAGNQSNGSADPPFSSSTKDSPDAGYKQSREEEKKDTEDPGNEDSEAPITEEPRVNQEKDNVNSTNKVNTVSSMLLAMKLLLLNKLDERGIVIRNKARLVAQGHTQEEGIDYDEVFAPVIRIKAISLFLAYASFKDLLVYQMDVKSVFIYGKIKEEVYVCQPPGFEDPDFPDKVYKVEKALYGLHQAQGAWYETLSTYLLDNGFQRGMIDKTLFIKRTKSDILLVQVYVNDIIFGSTRKEMCTEFEKMMHKKFQMSSMGELTFFLGLQGNPQQALKDKRVIGSGCSRYITGNMSYLSDFEELNGGYVAFGGNPKGGKIIGKGKIKTGKLDFDDVYFVKELKFNLFSVSHMCDKKNIVLFTDTECLVLSSDFKLLDASQVLLRVPRENNMLGHVNFKTINKLVKGNLVRGLPSKVFSNDNSCVACKKGKQHRASCKSKTVSSVDQPLFRLHMDLFGPTFVKSLRKVDEGFLVGYSVCSKAFRVFNSRTRIVQETLHDNFMENKPNVVGFGPAWLFDIDSLSQTMNYHSVIAENQTNSNASFPDTEKAGEEGTHTYVLFPVLSDGFINSQNNNKDALVDEKEHDDDIQKSVSPDIHSLSSGAQTRKQGDKIENKDKGKSPIVTITGFKDLNAEFEECNNNSSNGVNAASSLASTAGKNSINSTNNFSVVGPSNAAMPNLEDLSHSNDADDVGVEADINNMESIISVSPILTTRIHKIIQPLKLLVTCLQLLRPEVWPEQLEIKRAIGTKWVYRNKKDEKGIVIRNKARLVAQGHTQEEGIDYEEGNPQHALKDKIVIDSGYSRHMTRNMSYLSDFEELNGGYVALEVTPRVVGLLVKAKLRQ
nr:retrovirus-related Pol polyprotein from transposon TNT 1-94 [Tanacetum cinerariifolium]